jgi:MarR family transcriptional regulator, transcriptional regulator for hemolysin
LLRVTDSPTDLYRRFGARLLPLARSYRRHFDRELLTFSLSHSTALAVMLLGRMGEGVRQGALAEALGIEPPSVVPLVDGMERSGLVERHIDVSDKRARTLHLTAAGRALAARAEVRSAEVRAKLFAGIEEDDLRIALDVLDRLHHALDAEQG